MRIIVVGIMEYIMLPRGLRTKEEMMKNYRAAVKSVEHRTILSRATMAMSGFVGYCVLTWASVVVLGGFVANLNNADFESAALVLLLQAMQFASSTSWITFFPPPLLSDRPLYVIPGASFPDNARRLLPPFFSAVSESCIFLSLLLSSIELSSLVRTHDSHPFHKSLLIYYVLVLLNASISFIAFYLHMQRLSLRVVSVCLNNYSHRLLRFAIQGGEAYARFMKVEDMAFEMMGDECRYQTTKKTTHKERITACASLYLLCEELVSYMLNLTRGFEAALVAMESNDCYVQEAAILMVGFWAHLESTNDDGIATKRTICSQEALIRKVKEFAMSKNVDGRRKSAAMWSLERLAKHDAMGMIMKDEGLLEELVEHEKGFMVDNDQDCMSLMAYLTQAYASLLQDKQSRSKFTSDKISSLSKTFSWMLKSPLIPSSTHKLAQYSVLSLTAASTSDQVAPQTMGSHPAQFIMPQLVDTFEEGLQRASEPSPPLTWESYAWYIVLFFFFLLLYFFFIYFFVALLARNKT